MFLLLKAVKAPAVTAPAVTAPAVTALSSKNIVSPCIR